MNYIQHSSIANFIWGIADDVLRDVYVRGKYRDVILPMTVIRRLDALLEPTKKEVLDMKKQLDKSKVANQDAALCQCARQAFYNSSPFTLRDLKDARFITQHGDDPEYKMITRSSDGQLLFLVNKLSKMKHRSKLGSRIAEVHNGSSLFTGDAGGGETNIRRWIIENDWLEAIIALPENTFYNTGIATYIWLLTNKKPSHKKGQVQLIDASGWYVPLRKNLGKKNCQLSEQHIQDICNLVIEFKPSEQSKIFSNEAFGYQKITVERPLCFRGIDPEREYKAKEIKELKVNNKTDENGIPVIKKIHPKGKVEANPLYGIYEVEIKGKKVCVEYEPDTDLRDTEQVLLLEEGGIEGFFKREVLPYVLDAWIVPSKTQLGYEISFTKHFYKPTQLRTLEEIQKDIFALEEETEGILEDIVEESK
ncbi:MAG: N-6 DNA methylase [Candidatus Omnitrophica bacterium]|nr:N-6 DNA methylase [Candidatus Omnitrophota bacterium]